MLFWLGEIWSNFRENKFLKIFFLRWSLASETIYKKVDLIIFMPFCMQRRKMENLFENCHLCQRKVETHLRCVARSARDGSGSAAGVMPHGLHRWKCSVCTVTRRGSKDASSQWSCVLTTNYHSLHIYLDIIHLFCTKMCPLFCLYQSQKSSRWGTLGLKVGHARSGCTQWVPLFCQSQGKSPLLYTCMCIYAFTQLSMDIYYSNYIKNYYNSIRRWATQLKIRAISE